MAIQRGVRSPKDRRRPDSGQIRDAVELLNDELLADFPFVADADRAHALALLVLPFVRELIEGRTPLHLIEKPTPGTGATLLAEVVGTPVLGPTLPAMTAATDEEEMRKRIFAKLSQSLSYVLLDNVHRVDSEALSTALTSAPAYEDRVLL